MSGAQGAQPPGCETATTYKSVEGRGNKPKLDPLSKEDEGGVQVDQLQEKVPDAAGQGGPVFGSSKDVDVEEDKQDLGVTGTG
ncbi:uncharacterized protein LOC130761705 [Actinidia eriantha]|uniref:uncharacterized protein LOC130761705 n=1 Tax=Actinidia eriantha TaxID=165200 RepID=UPI002586226B|nr:uncharacterized protein LOC130761705 [Actinidia eriantha]